VSPSWFSRSPLPDTTGLFVNWQGTTGVVTKLAVQAWPMRLLRERRFIMCRRAEDGLALMLKLGKTGLYDDVGALSWPISRYLLAIHRPGPRDPAEPELYLYVDLSADSSAELAAKRTALEDHLLRAKKAGAKMERPLDVRALVALDPAFEKLAELPARLDGLLDHPGGGLSWVGTYGPPAQVIEGGRRGMELMQRHGFPPLLVSRPMRGGHFTVLRFIEIFDRHDPAEVQRLATLQREILQMLLELGYLPYKAPGWAVEELLPRMDPGSRALVARLRATLDPNGILQPERWWR
jgi:FAD/FMN-containing dehydrogenase